jgi:PTS system nitrogen regulatory IIA component
MFLSDLLQPSFIHLRNDIQGMDEATDHLIGHFLKSSPVGLERAAVRSAIDAREALGGTVFPTGIAVPHGRLADFDDLLVGVCVPLRPVPVQGTSVRMIVLMLTSKAGSPVYLNTLAAWLKLSQDQVLFGRLIGARTPVEFIEIIHRAGITVREKVTAEDVMQTEVPHISTEATLRELADLFFTRGAAYAAVTSPDGRLAGEVRLMDLLRAGLPPFTDGMENLRFLESFAPLEALAEREDTIRVREVMNRAPVTLDPETPVVEVVLKLLRSSHDCLPVVAGGRLLGVVCSSEILRRIVRA